MAVVAPPPPSSPPSTPPLLPPPFLPPLPPFLPPFPPFSPGGNLKEAVSFDLSVSEDGEGGDTARRQLEKCVELQSSVNNHILIWLSEKLAHVTAALTITYGGGGVRVQWWDDCEAVRPLVEPELHVSVPRTCSLAY